jgi:hypothetical protein
MTERVEPERLARARTLRELAAKTENPEERDRLLGAAAEAEGLSLNGAGFARPSG